MGYIDQGLGGAGPHWPEHGEIDSSKWIDAVSKSYAQQGGSAHTNARNERINITRVKTIS